MPNYIKNLLISMNKNGILVPLVHDPKVNKGSVTLTLVFISSLYVQIGLIGKYSKMLGDIDMTSAITWFALCMGLYGYNKKISINKTSGIVLESNEEEDKDATKTKTETK